MTTILPFKTTHSVNSTNGSRFALTINPIHKKAPENTPTISLDWDGTVVDDSASLLYKENFLKTPIGKNILTECLSAFCTSSPEFLPYIQSHIGTIDKETNFDDFFRKLAFCLYPETADQIQSAQNKNSRNVLDRSLRKIFNNNHQVQTLITNGVLLDYAPELLDALKNLRNVLTGPNIFQPIFTVITNSTQQRVIDMIHGDQLLQLVSKGNDQYDLETPTIMLQELQGLFPKENIYGRPDETIFNNPNLKPYTTLEMVALHNPNMNDRTKDADIVIPAEGEPRPKRPVRIHIGDSMPSDGGFAEGVAALGETVYFIHVDTPDQPILSEDTSIHKFQNGGTYYRQSADGGYGDCIETIKGMTKKFKTAIDKEKKKRDPSANEVKDEDIRAMFKKLNERSLKIWKI